MKSSWVLNVTMILNLGILVPSWAQDTNDGLDFLDKVENIKIPVEPQPSQKTSTTTKSNTTETKKTVKPQTTTKKTLSTTSTAKKSTTTKKTTTPISSSLTSPTSNSTSKSSTVSPSITKSSTSEASSTEDNKLDEQTAASLESAEWIDESLEMKPDYLPGFAGNIPQENRETEDNKETDTAKIYPLPTVTGNYSIWNSFTEFLSKYQKAFYIFGILILFGLYRLRSGGNSSRKSSPTIRRMRR